MKNINEKTQHTATLNLDDIVEIARRVDKEPSFETTSPGQLQHLLIKNIGDYKNVDFMNLKD